MIEGEPALVDRSNAGISDEFGDHGEMPQAATTQPGECNEADFFFILVALPVPAQ